MRTRFRTTRIKVRSRKGFSLVEAVIAMLLAGVIIGAIVGGFVQALRVAEAASYSLAAHSLAMEGLEQARSAKWDALPAPYVDELVSSNFTPDIHVLDIPRGGTNRVYATNFTTITLISTNPLIKMIRVDCVYPFMSRGLLTNTIASYRAPETGQNDL